MCIDADHLPEFYLAKYDYMIGFGPCLKYFQCQPSNIYFYSDYVVWLTWPPIRNGLISLQPNYSVSCIRDGKEKNEVEKEWSDSFAATEFLRF